MLFFYLQWNVIWNFDYSIGQDKTSLMKSILNLKQGYILHIFYVNLIKTYRGNRLWYYTLTIYLIRLDDVFFQQQTCITRGASYAPITCGLVCAEVNSAWHAIFFFQFQNLEIVVNPVENAVKKRISSHWIMFPERNGQIFICFNRLFFILIWWMVRHVLCINIYKVLTYIQLYV